jgi:uncharacterized protein RhaS with RHS repeats
LEGGINTYAYVRNNPLRWIDSLGLQDNSTSDGGQGNKQGNKGGRWGLQEIAQGETTRDQCLQNATAAGGIAGAIVTAPTFPVGTFFGITGGAIGGYCIGLLVCK